MDSFSAIFVYLFFYLLIPPIHLCCSIHLAVYPAIYPTVHLCMTHTLCSKWKKKQTFLWKFLFQSIWSNLNPFQDQGSLLSVFLTGLLWSTVWGLQYSAVLAELMWIHLIFYLRQSNLGFCGSKSVKMFTFLLFAQLSTFTFTFLSFWSNIIKISSFLCLLLNLFFAVYLFINSFIIRNFFIHL